MVIDFTQNDITIYTFVWQIHARKGLAQGKCFYRERKL